MPAPIAHAGLALALAYGGGGARQARAAGLLVFVALAADLDFIPGVVTGRAVAFHHGATHSYAFALGMAALAWVFLRERPVALLLAALSHPVLDWLTGEPGADVPTYGVALWWPILDTRYMSGWHLFGAYHIDTMGLFGGVLTPGAVRPLLGELGFVVLCFAIVRLWKWRRRTLWMWAFAAAILAATYPPWMYGLPNAMATRWEGGQAFGREIDGHAPEGGLDGLKTEFRRAVVTLLERLHAAGFETWIRAGRRNELRQAVWIWAGYSKTLRSAHIRGEAVDLLTPIPMVWVPEHAAFFLRLRHEATALGLQSGGDWERQGAWAYWDLGWDPAHVEASPR